MYLSRVSKDLDLPRLDLPAWPFNSKLWTRAVLRVVTRSEQQPPWAATSLLMASDPEEHLVSSVHPTRPNSEPSTTRNFQGPLPPPISTADIPGDHMSRGNRRSRTLHESSEPVKREPVEEEPPKDDAGQEQSKRGKWTKEEDDYLIDLRMEEMEWPNIAERFEGRSYIACRLHYQNYLERRYPWTEDQVAKLARLYDR